jgi:RsiW-degrading membrane proteinase PrsW (M82 family)
VRLRSLLFTRYGEPRLVLPGLLGVLIAFIVTLAFITLSQRPQTDEQRAESLLRNGRPAQAERLYARLLAEHPTAELALALVEAHEQARLYGKIRALHDSASRDQTLGLPPAESPLDEAELDAQLASLPTEIALIARFLRGRYAFSVSEDLRTRVLEGAKREPPIPWTNHVLGTEAQVEGKLKDAATYFAREGVSFPGRHRDVDAALTLWLTLGEWDTARDHLRNPKFATAAAASSKYKLAVHDRDWRMAIRWLAAASIPAFEGMNVFVSVAGALGWAFFCGRLGNIGSRRRFKLPLYALAFVFGIASVAMTLVLIAIEESTLRLVETGDIVRDALFFVFGVGLREEASKLAFFSLLLPVLRRSGNKLDVLVCGALVGLGFAAEENLGYLAHGSLQTGLSRFLTANFFHMALTGTLAAALDEFLSDQERYASDFFRTSFFIVAIHGAYDFFLSHEEFGGGFLAMTAFVLLARLFLHAVDSARRRSDGGMSPLHAFIVAIAVVTGASLAVGTVALGAKSAFLMLGSGLVAQAILVYVFVRSLRSM